MFKYNKLKYRFIQLLASTDNIYDAVAARYGQCTGALGLRQTCAELAGYVAIPKRIKGKKIQTSRIQSHFKKSPAWRWRLKQWPFQLNGLLLLCGLFITNTCKKQFWGFYIKKNLDIIFYVVFSNVILLWKLIIFLDVTEMHKAEIATENEELKHYVQCYDHMFERAQKRLINLRQQYEESKQHLPPKRYPLLKEMVKTVIRDKKLMPDGFNDCASSEWKVIKGV